MPTINDNIYAIKSLIVLVYSLDMTLLFGKSKRKIEGKTADEWFELGFEETNPKKEIKYFSKALELDPEIEEAWYNKGFALGRLGRYEEALECYERSLELNSDDGDAWYDKGELLYKLGRFGEALECYYNVLELDPKKYKTSKNRELAKQRLKELEKMKVDLVPESSLIHNSGREKKNQSRDAYHIKPFHGYQICPNCGGGEMEYAGISSGHVIFPGVNTAQLYTCKICGYQGSAIIEIDTPNKVKEIRKYLRSHKGENLAPTDSLALALGYPKEYVWLWRALLVIFVIVIIIPVISAIIYWLSGK